MICLFLMYNKYIESGDDHVKQKVPGSQSQVTRREKRDGTTRAVEGIRGYDRSDM